MSVKKIPLICLALLITSCAGSRMEIKPETNKSSLQNDTIYAKPKEIFSAQMTESTIDSVVIPKRQKQEKTPQIIVAPIILPITTYPTQVPEQKFETKKIEQAEPISEPKPEVKTPPVQPEIKEKKIEPTAEIKPQQIAQRSKFFIQIGAFVTQSSANEQLDKFKKLYPDINAEVILDSTLNLYKVQINGVDDSLKIVQTLEKIQENFPDAFITSRTVSTNQNIMIKEQTNSTSKPQLKIQIGAYSKLSHAQKIKEYIQSKFKVKSEIIEEKGIFKVFILLNEDDITTLNEIKSEFTDAFILK